MIECIIGIDIGVVGAVARLSPDGERLIEVADLPVLKDGPAGRRTICAPLFADIIQRWQPTRAYVETVGARPGEGPVGAFAFGRSRGVIEGCLGACKIPVAWITPASWKKTVGLTLASKDAARAAVIRRFPAHAGLFARVKDDGRAEACLIAIACVMRARA